MNTMHVVHYSKLCRSINQGINGEVYSLVNTASRMQQLVKIGAETPR